MAYKTSYDMLKSEGLMNRMIACAASLGESNPVVWIEQHKWAMLPLMITPPDGNGNSQGWWQVWEYAEANMTVNNNPDIGARNDVILDTWIESTILAHRQALGIDPTP